MDILLFCMYEFMFLSRVYGCKIKLIFKIIIIRDVDLRYVITDTRSEPITHDWTVIVFFSLFNYQV